MFIDEKGRLFKKVSIIDLLLILIVVGLAVSYGVKSFSSAVRMVLSTKETFYVVFSVEGVRDFTRDSIQVGDIFYEQHAGLIGKVVNVEEEQHYSTMLKYDGTASLVPVENRYKVNITFECSGNKNDNGYYLNGNRNISVGTDMFIKSNMTITSGSVSQINEGL